MVGPDVPFLALMMYPSIPVRAWRGIAMRLDFCAQIVPSESAGRFIDRAKDAWARAGGAQ